MKTNFIALSTLLLCSACDPITWLVGGTIAGTTAASRNSLGIGGTISDIEIESSISSAIAQYASKAFDKIELAVKHGHVVIIGYLDNEEQSAKVIDIVKRVPGAIDIINEIQIGKMPTGEQNVLDSAITSRIKSCLMFDGNVKAMNYDITTVKGIVYIVGTAGSAYERSVVLNLARTTSDVVKVVSYIYIQENRID